MQGTAQPGAGAAAGISEALAYWSQQLAGAPPQLALPTDVPPPPLLSGRRGAVRATLPPALVDGLRHTGSGTDAALFEALMACWQVLLSRYARTEDVVTGCLLDEHCRSTLRARNGATGSLVPLRTELSGHPSFSELVGHVKAAVADAWAHPGPLLKDLAAALGGAPGGRRCPLFQTALALRGAGGPHRTLSAVVADVLGVRPEHCMEADGGSVLLDLAVELVEGDEGMEMTLDYSADLFRESTAQRIAGHYLTLLANAAAAPYAPVDSLGILTAPERELVLHTFNAVEVPPSSLLHPEQTLHGLLEHRAATTPGAPACVFEARPKRRPSFQCVQ